DDVLVASAVLDSQARKIVDVHAADAVVASPTNGKDGQPAQQPRDVVQQYAVSAEENRRAEDGERQLALDERALDKRLAPEVRIGRLDARVGDADVHDSTDAGAPRCVEQCA